MAMPPNVNNLTFVPGTELVFGPQARRRAHVNETIARVFAGWGFSEIILPSFDLRDPAEGDGDTYTLIDREGRGLALRDDFTRVAVKALAIELRRAPRTIRACYEGRVYRFQPSGHGARVEQSQRGLEWVNVRGPVYDAAAILIARECLDALGLQPAVLVVGHAAFVNAALGARGRADRALLEAVDHKNPARIRELAARRGLESKAAELLARLPDLCGGSEVITAARALAPDAAALAALDELEAIMKLLGEAGLVRGVLVDLGEVRRFDYYSGMMFKVYHPDVGDDLGGGGRYDRLFDRHGLDVPAVGLGLDIARVTEALPRTEPINGDTPPQAVAAGTAGALAQALKARAQGRAVALGEGV